MGIEQRVRPISLLLVKNQEKYLVIRGHDSKKREDFYRPIGGGIEFGESSDQALIREVKEEVDAEIKNIRLLGVFENIFTYEGRPGHEIAMVYSAEFVDEKFYTTDKLKMLDSPRNEWCYWVDKKVLQESNFYPEGIKQYLTEA
jgi:ADP-ribose pyrophosphatase YjhB (NUDIX family)